MRHSTVKSALACLQAIVIIIAHANPLAKRSSPALSGYNADPNIVVFGDTYYIYPTTDGYSGWSGDTFYPWSSTDLATWTRTSDPILTLNGTSGNVPWATGYAWAPTIIERNSKYYIYFSGENPSYSDIKTIGVAVSSAPEGSFTAQSEAMLVNNLTIKTNQVIDPAVFEDPVSGRYYIYFGNGVPLVAELNDDMVSIDTSTLKEPAGLTNFTEASFMVYRNGLYHYTYSNGDTELASYNVQYATSTSPTGPFTYHGVILSENATLGILGTGSSSIVNVPNTDDWYIAYHRFAIPDGDGTHREVTIDHLYFDDDGYIIPVVPTLTGVAAI
ncbi:glycosyl hydrolase [Xylariaceae sp. FL0255]|nr:glycosyl hydrolase [Xylariaceae sp. FL0255]